MLLSTFIPIASRYHWLNLNYITCSIWFDVFWACYKNLTLVGLSFLLIFNNKVSNTDKRFLSFAIMVNIAQCFMYALCPLAGGNQLLIDISFGSFCILIAAGLGVTWGG